MAAVVPDVVPTSVGKVQVRRGGAGSPLVYLHSAAGEGEGLPLLDQLAAPALMGLSLGGWMAAELATRYPKRVSRLILVNPAGLYIAGAEIKDIFGRAPTEMAADLFADQSHPMAQMMRQMDRTMADSAALSTIPFELIRPQLQAMAATARLAWNPYLHNPKLRERLGRINSPTIVVRGAQDTLIPAAHAQTYAMEIPGANLLEVPNTAHLISVERPEQLAAIVNDFLGD